MRILMVGPGGRTGRHVIAALQAHHEHCDIIGFSRNDPCIDHVEFRKGDLENPVDRANAVEGIDAVIYYGPPFHPRETALGTGMIDAAVAAGVCRSVFISVIHPQIDDWLNHKAKLDVEAHLIATDLAWTIIRPQHLMQNVDAAAIAQSGLYRVPYDTTSRLGHVDLADVGSVVAKVIMEPGHQYAAYDLSAADSLSARRNVREIRQDAAPHLPIWWKSQCTDVAARSPPRPHLRPMLNALCDRIRLTVRHYVSWSPRHS